MRRTHIYFQASGRRLSVGNKNPIAVWRETRWVMIIDKPDGKKNRENKNDNLGRTLLPFADREIPISRPGARSKNKADIIVGNSGAPLAEHQRRPLMIYVQECIITGIPDLVLG